MLPKSLIDTGKYHVIKITIAQVPPIFKDYESGLDDFAIH